MYNYYNREEFKEIINYLLKLYDEIYLILKSQGNDDDYLSEHKEILKDCLWNIYYIGYIRGFLIKEKAIIEEIEKNKKIYAEETFNKRIEYIKTSLSNNSVLDLLTPILDLLKQIDDISFSNLENKFSLLFSFLTLNGDLKSTKDELSDLDYISKNIKDNIIKTIIFEILTNGLKFFDGIAVENIKNYEILVNEKIYEMNEYSEKKLDDEVIEKFKKGTFLVIFKIIDYISSENNEKIKSSYILELFDFLYYTTVKEYTLVDLLKFTLLTVYFDKNINNYSDDLFLRDLYMSHRKIIRTVNRVKNKDCYKDVFLKYATEILKKKLEFIIRKFRLSNRVNYLHDSLDNHLEEFEENKSEYSNVVNYIDLIFKDDFKEEHNNEIIKGIKNKGRLSLVEIFIYTKYLKIQNKASKLENFYNFYEDGISRIENKIYIKNGLLTVLVENYKNYGEDKSKIEKLFKEIEKMYDNNKTYYTYYLYSKFKLCEYEKEKNNPNVDLSSIIKEAENNLNIAKKLLENKNDEHSRYLYYDFDECYVELSNSKFGIDKLYFYNLYTCPISKKGKMRLEELETHFLQCKYDIKYVKGIKEIDNLHKNYKIEAITIIGIFTGIVVFIFGEMEILSNIKDTHSAILISGIFLSGILLLIGTVYGKEKDWKFFIISLLIFSISIFIVSCEKIGEFIPNKPLNTNKNDQPNQEQINSNITNLEQTKSKTGSNSSSENNQIDDVTSVILE